MRHRRRVKHFSRKPTHRKAMWRNLIVSLVEHGRIKTTVDKAKELRGHVERAITIGKADTLATYRLLLSRIANEGTVSSILKEVSPRFKTRQGGYTRIIKLGPRPGDQAEMAFIEFVDYDYNKAAAAPHAKAAKAGKGKKEGAKVDKAEAKAKAKAAKEVTKLAAAKRKHLRKIQSKARAFNRPE